MFKNDKNDIKLIDTKSTKLDRKRSKREDSFSEQTGFKQFLEKTFEKRMEIVEQLQKERDAVL